MGRRSRNIETEAPDPVATTDETAEMPEPATPAEPLNAGSADAPVPEVPGVTPRLVLSLNKPQRLGNGDRKAGTVIAYLTPAEGATLSEIKTLLLNPALQKVTREDAK